MGLSSAPLLIPRWDESSLGRRAGRLWDRSWRGHECVGKGSGAWLGAPQAGQEEGRESEKLSWKAQVEAREEREGLEE